MLDALWVHHERADLEAKVVEAIDRGGTVVLVGPPGVGKTTIVDGVVTRLRAVGRAVERLAASPAMSALPWSGIAPLVGGATSGDLVGRALDGLRPPGEPSRQLVIDDLHDLDDASSVVVHQLAARAVPMLVTMRPGRRLSPAIAHLLASGSTTHIAVEPLDDTAARSLVRASLGGPVEPRSLDTLVRAAGGIPLYLRELVTGSRAAGVLIDADGVWRFRGELATTPVLEELLVARLSTLDEIERDAVEILALTGRLELTVAAAVVGERTLERLERAGVATVDGDRVALAHPLYAELVRRRTGELAARRHYRALAAASDDLPVHSEAARLRRTVWQVRADRAEDAALVEQAARMAMNAADASLAVELSLAALAQRPSMDAAFIAARSLSELGEHARSEDVLRAAVANAPDARSRAAFQLRLAEERWWWGRDVAAARTLLDAGMTGDDEADAILRAQHGVFDLLSGRVERAGATAYRLRDHPSTAVQFVNGITWSQWLTYRDRADEGFEVASRCVDISTSEGSELLGDSYVHVVGQVLALVHGGRLAEARAAVAFIEDVAALQSSVVARAWAATICGFAELFGADPARAVTPFANASALWLDASSPGPARWAATGLALARAATGDVDGADAALVAADGIDPTGFELYEPLLELGRSWTAHLRHDQRRARRHAELAVEAAGTSAALVHVAVVGHDLARLGMVDLAVRAMDALDGEPGPMTAARRQFVAAAANADGNGLAAVADAFEALGASLFAAEALTMASVLARRAGSSRQQREWQGRAGRLLASTPGADTPMLRLGQRREVLSSRERQVAVLAAQGLSNRAVAERLIIGERTVETHVQHAMSKLGITSRRQLGDALAELDRA